MEAWKRLQAAFEEGRDRQRSKKNGGKESLSSRQDVRKQGIDPQASSKKAKVVQESATLGKTREATKIGSEGVKRQVNMETRPGHVAEGVVKGDKASGMVKEAVSSTVESNGTWWKRVADEVKSGRASAKFSENAKKFQEKWKGKGFNMGMKVDVDVFGPTFESIKKGVTDAWMTMPPEVRRASPYVGTVTLAMWISQLAFVNPSKRREIEARRELADVLVENKKLRKRIAELEEKSGSAFSSEKYRDSSVALAEAIAAAVQAAAAAAQAAAAASEVAAGARKGTVQGMPATEHSRLPSLAKKPHRGSAPQEAAHPSLP